ncbi:MAG: hypothetical protein IKR85_05810 [Clostridia bacterium]|nr:hypothetical protein [Clostridia bacterium]
MIYSENVVARVEDFDSRGNMTVSAVIKLFENAAMHHSRAANDDVLEGHEKGAAWVLTGWQVQVNRLPSHSDALRVETWTVGTEVSPVHSYRDAHLLDGTGAEMVKARMTFVLLDLRTGRVTKLTPELISAYKPEMKSLFVNDSYRMTLPDTFERELSLRVRRSDIDFNAHVHNVAYFDYALELLPDEDAQRVRALRIIYKASLKYGDTALVKGTKDADTWKIGIFNGDKPYTLIEIQTGE